MKTSIVYDEIKKICLLKYEFKIIKTPGLVILPKENGWIWYSPIDPPITKG